MNDMTPVKVARPAGISDAEWQLRVELAAAYRMVDYFGWCELIYGHLTAKVPGPDLHFLINPYGLNYDEVTASNLVKIDVEGNKIDVDNPYGVNQAGFVIHSAVHMAHSDLHQVVDAHPFPLGHGDRRGQGGGAANLHGLHRLHRHGSATTITRASACIWTSATASWRAWATTTPWC